jgi:AAA domain
MPPDNVEDDATEQRRRLSAALRQFGAKPADIRGKVIRTGPNGIGTLLIRDDHGRIRFTPAMDRLEHLIRQHNACSLSVDPLAELHNTEENDNTALRAIVARFRELATDHNIAVQLPHHTRKGGSSSPGDPDIARGASAIIGAVRIAHTLTVMSEDDASAFGLPTDAQARSHYVRLDDAKQNYAAIRDAEWFEKVPHLLDNGELVPAAEPWMPPAQKQASQVEIASLASAIERGTPDREPYSPKLSKEPRSVKALLEQYGFFGDAQKPVMTRLATEHDVTTGHYRQPGRRNDALGLHIAFRPAANWVGQEPADSPTSAQRPAHRDDSAQQS